MINLLYHSHTVVPAHLEELLGLGVLDHDEQVLVALDGVLLDAAGKRLSGPTLHDYVLLTNLRLILWARDYGKHLCCAFPLEELYLVDGAGLDPLHAQLQLAFAAPGEAEQHFALTLLPLSSLVPALDLLRSAAETTRALVQAGLPAREAGGEVIAVLTEHIYGHADARPGGVTPYRWPGASAPATPGAAYQHDMANVPPEPVYAAGRLARSAWDTLKRSLREADLPLDLNANSLRELTEAVRAINDLVTNVAANPAAQQMAMAFLSRKQAGAVVNSEPDSHIGQGAAAAPAMNDETASAYREIPLRRRGDLRPASAAPPQTRAAAVPVVAPGIPLRRRGMPRPAVSGSGDADEQ
jgi:hypothetical protein